MNWQNVRTLVTGAGGFIGSHLVEELVSRGASVRALVRYNSRADLGLLATLPAEVRRKLEIVSGDLLDARAVRDSVRDCELVFHLGALISIPYSNRMPQERGSDKCDRDSERARGRARVSARSPNTHLDE
jgi:nucleoside-diphosphate-sugar epimerase